MPQKLSPVATSLIVLLNNIQALCVQSQDRAMAKDAMKALQIYAKNKSFPLPEDKIEMFYDVLLDSRPLTLASILRDVAADVAHLDLKIS